MANIERLKTVAELEMKGSKWLAEELWRARQNAKNARAELKESRNEHWKNQRDLFATDCIKEANENMAKVLKDNGIRPTKLRMTFIKYDCDNCHAVEDGDYWSCDECDRGEKAVKNVSFYTYDIEDGFLNGITADFKAEEYEVLKVVDDRTGEVIWESKKK